MPKKEKSKGEAVFDLVHDWVKSDSPKRIEDAVHRWVGRKPLGKKGAISTPS